MNLKIKHGKNTIQSIDNTHATVSGTVKRQTTGLGGTLEGVTLKNLIDVEYRTFTINSTDDTINKTSTSRIRQFNLVHPLKTDKQYLIIYEVLSITDGYTTGSYLKNSTVSGSTQYSIANAREIGKRVAIVTPTTEANQFAIYFDKSTTEKVATFTTPMIFEYVEGMENWDIPFFTGMQSVQNPVVKVTGKNLLYLPSNIEIIGGHYNLATLTNSNNTLTLTGNGTETQEIYVKTLTYVYLEKGKQYTVSWDTDCEIGGEQGTDTVEMFLAHNNNYEDSSAFFHINKKVKTISPNYTGKYYLRLDLNSGTKTHTFYNLQVEEGSVATAYEPYLEHKVITDYRNMINPQAIETDTQTRASWNMRLEDDVVVCTRISSSGGQFGAFVKVDVKPNTEYTLSLKQTFDGANDGAVYIYSNSSIWGTDIALAYANATKTFKTPSDCKYITLGLAYYKDVPVGSVCKIWDIQLEEGATATPYVPYQGTLELHGVGTVRDVINLETGIYQRRFRKIVLDGSNDEVWDSYSDVTDFATKGFYCIMDYELRGKNAICDLFPTGKPSNIQPNVTPLDVEAICVDGRYVKLRILGAKASSLTNLRTWLSHNPITVIYELSVVPSTEKINIHGNLVTYRESTSFATQSETINPILKANIPTTMETTDIPNNMILDKLEFNEDIGVNDFTVGKFILPTMKTKIHNDIEVKQGDIFTVYLDDEKYHTYEPYEIKKGNMSREITCYSLPYFSLTQNFVPYGTSYTTRSLLLEMQTALNFVVVGFQNIAVVDMPNVKPDTAINLLQAVAMLLQSNVRINPHGEIEFIKVNTTTTHTIAQSQITSIVKSDTTDYQITQITGKLSEDDESPIVVGASANTWNNLTLINPYLTQSVCTTILGSLPQYSGFDIKIFNAPVIKPLEKIKFTYQGVEYIIPVMDVTTSYSTGGLVTRIKANVSNANDKVSNYKGSLTTRLDVIKNITSELNTKITVVDGNIGTLISKTDVIEGDITTINEQYSQINQTIGEIDLRVGEVQTEISDKVSTDEVISSINLSTEGVKIKGDKIQLTGGTVVVSADGTSMSLDEYLKAEDDSENFVLTPNFNSGSLSPNWTWSVGSFVYIDTTYKHGESTACRLKGSAGAISLNTKNLSINKLEKGKTYKLSMWIYCTDTSSVTGEFQLCMYGKPSGATSNILVDSLSFNGDNLNANQWTRLSFEFTPSQEYSTPSITVKGVSGKIDAWVTDFELVQKGEAFTQEQLINIVNGAGDGFYILDGQAYINAEYIQTGTLRADLIRVQVDGTSNLIPFNYVTMDNAINTTAFGVRSANDIPYLSCDLPIYQGGASADVKCTQIGYSDVEIESGKEYWFMCEYYAYWGSDTKPDDGVGTSTATSGSKNGGLQNGQNMTLFLYNGDNPIHAKNDGYFQLATVYDFNASIKIEEREGYTGVYERTWTTLTAKFTATESYKGKLCINLDCSGFIYNGEGGSFHLRRLQLTDATQSEPVFIDYTKQVKEKHMELSDGSYYKNIVGVDGMQIENGYITGKYPLSSRGFTIDDDGFRCHNTIGSENAFVGVNQSYYTYDGGSSGQITGYDDIYGFGCREIVGGTSEGIFIGVHEGFQKPNSTEYGRADIYTLYKDGYAFDTHDWTLLGEKIEPKGLVRRDDYANVTTQSCLCIAQANGVGGATYNGSTVFNEALYNAVGNGQLINVNTGDNRIYVGNPNTILLLESAYGLAVNEAGEHKQVVTNGTQYGNVQLNLYTGNSIEIWADKDYSTTTERVWIGAGANAITITSNGTAQSNSCLKYNSQEIIHGGNREVTGMIYGTYKSGCTSVDNLNNIWRGGFYEGFNLANAPEGNTGWFWVINSSHSNNHSGYRYGLQIAGLNVQGNAVWMRCTNDQGAGTWYRYYNTGWQQTSTSDIRYKRAIADVNTSDCYDMVKNTQLHHYLLLDDTDELRACSEDGIEELETELDSEGYSRKVQMGIIAQDVLKYECGKYFVVQDINKDDDGNITSDKYSIDAYNYASAILGGLQEEIRIRDNQYEELKQENEELKQRLARIEAMLNQ